MVWAQTNATSITSGGYYRLYSAAKSKTLYADAANNGVSINQPATGDNTDVYQLTSSDDNYTIKSVGTNKFLNGFTSGSKFNINGKNWVTLSETSQTFQVKKNASARAVADKSRWIIGYNGAAITDDNWFNTNVNNTGKGGLLRWKVDEGSKDDAASYFEIYPCDPYTLTVTGETDKNATITAKGYNSQAANGGTVYIDASATQGDLTVSTDDGYTATITTFDTSNKTITVNVSANRIVGTYKLKTTFNETDYYFSLPQSEGSSPVLSTSEAEVELVECGTGYMLKKGEYYLAYKGGNDYDLIATSTVSNAAVFTVTISGTTMTLKGNWKNLYLCVNSNSIPSSIYGDGNPSGNKHNTYWAYQWTIADFTAATTYTRVFEAAQSYTVCLPMAVSTSSVTNGTFYELSSYSENTLHFNEVSGTTTAYKPYLFVTSAAGVVLAGDITAYSDQDLTTSISGASMTGTVSSQTLVSTGSTTYYGYRASDGNFVQVGTSTGAHIGAYRAYISIPGTSGVKAFNVQLDDATGIANVNANLNANERAIYNLSGQRVSNPTRGLYIVNGRKVAIK